MRMLRYTILPALLMSALLVITGCQDLSVENKNDPDRERALAEPADLVSLLEGGHDDVFQEIIGIWAVHQNELADQTTSTNAFWSFWDFAEEPRLRINNTTTYADPQIMNSPWSSFNAGVSTANQIITVVEQDGKSVVIDGNDRTQEVRAAAYFLRGVARGYIGMIYDKGYIVGPDSDVTNLETKSYSKLISAAEKDLNKSLEVADQVGGSFRYNFFPTSDQFSLAQFKEIVHSFRARFLINEARTNEEASNWPDSRWNKILDAANKGVGVNSAMRNFLLTSVGDFTFWHPLAGYSGFKLSDNSDYLPNDIKVAHLLDPSYPVEYPTEEGVVLDEAESSDPRLEYFAYTPNFGFLRAGRNRALFSNYTDMRMWSGNQFWGGEGNPLVYITEAEIQYIKAEANLWLGNKGAAADALDNSPRGDNPADFRLDLPSVRRDLVDYGGNDGLAANKDMDPGASQPEFIRALHTEYSVELHLLTGMGVKWAFMRRHNLLQEGTPLHFAIPGAELEVTQSENYTFGGASHASEDGTASGSNSWKTFDERHGLNQSGAASEKSDQSYRPLRLKLENLPHATYGNPIRNK